jgi:hypothetical protein
MRKRPLVVVTSAAVVAVVAAVSLSGGAAAQPVEGVPSGAQPLTTSEIRSTALLAASQDEEMAPTSVEETSGTLAQVISATSPQDTAPAITDPRTGRPWAESAVDVVTMRGEFKSNGPRPPETPAPTGTVLTVTIDAKSGRVVGQTLGQTPVALDQINPTVTTLGG